jgi:hypothetical protein
MVRARGLCKGGEGVSIRRLSLCVFTRGVLLCEHAEGGGQHGGQGMMHFNSSHCGQSTGESWVVGQIAEAEAVRLSL